MLCAIGIHKWNHSCKCERCGKTRDKNHDWEGCKCKICGKTRDENHNWNGCKCLICGKVRDSGHKLEGCFCIICKREVHDWRLTNKKEEIERIGGGVVSPHTYVTVEVIEKQWLEYTCQRCGKIRQEYNEKNLGEDDIC